MNALTISLTGSYWLAVQDALGEDFDGVAVNFFGDGTANNGEPIDLSGRLAIPAVLTATISRCSRSSVAPVWKPQLAVFSHRLTATLLNVLQTFCVSLDMCLCSCWPVLWLAEDGDPVQLMFLCILSLQASSTSASTWRACTSCHASSWWRITCGPLA